MSIFEERYRHVAARVWDPTRTGFRFPECERLDERAAVGLCFSGGGTRSAALTCGQLRALRALGLLDRVGYLSAVSGGSWAALPWVYLPPGRDEEEFLGAVRAPEEITVRDVERLPPRGFLHATASAGILDDLFGHALRFAGDETYARAVGELFLEPFGLDSWRRFFTLSSETLGGILARNPDARSEDFHLVRAGRPFLVVGGTIVRPTAERDRFLHLPFEMTPLYAGVRSLFARLGSQGQHLGGTLVEPLGFDSDAPVQGVETGGIARVRLGGVRHRFTLSDVVGTSGAALVTHYLKKGIDWIGFPEFKVWPVRVAKGTVRRAKEYTFGDGGYLEKLGLLALLARRVSRIIAFVNTNDPVSRGEITNDSIPPLFGLTRPFQLNRVFPRHGYAPLARRMAEAKRAGQPLVVRDRYAVLDNEHHGIEGGWEVEILWVYNERVASWTRRLRTTVRTRLRSLGPFPLLKTFFHNRGRVIDLTAPQAALLAHLACFGVLANEERFRAFVDGRSDPQG